MLIHPRKILAATCNVKKHYNNMLNANANRNTYKKIHNNFFLIIIMFAHMIMFFRNIFHILFGFLLMQCLFQDSLND